MRSTILKNMTRTATSSWSFLMIDPIITIKVIMFVGTLLLGQTLSNMIRDHSQNTSNLENPF